MTDEQRVEKLAEELAARNERTQKNFDDRLLALERQSVDKSAYERRHEALEAQISDLRQTLFEFTTEMKGDLREWRGRLWALSLIGPVVIAVLSEVIRRFAMGGKP